MKRVDEMASDVALTAQQGAFESAEKPVTELLAD